MLYTVTRRKQNAEGINVRTRYASFVVLAAVASLAACVAPTSSSEEDVGQTSEAVSTGGLTASITITSSSSQTYSASMTVANGGDEPASNWQVALNLGSATMQGAPNPQSGSELLHVGSQTVIGPGAQSTTLQPGQSVTITWNAQFPQGSSSWKPTVASVDGVASGTVYNQSKGWPSGSVDMIARSVATGALNLAIAYENYKLPNTGDANYPYYDNLIWASTSFVVSGGEIAFDPNVPGYAFIPPQAVAALEAMQDSPEVASYLTAGLTSCFLQGADNVYSFKAGVLKGFVYPGSSKSVSIIGGRPTGVIENYNPLDVTDSFTTSGVMSNGAEAITITLKGTTVYPDLWFGILTASGLQLFPNTQAVYNKYMGGNSVACSPFNGPGGTANPYFAMTLNGSSVPARFQGVGQQCQGSGCSSTMTVDPDPYAVVGPFYNTAGIVGPQPNPFSLDPSVVQATPDHQGQYATSINSSGATVYGTFSSAVVHKGITTGYGWVEN